MAIEKAYYSGESLRRGLDEFERRFGIDSDAFYEAFRINDESVIGPIPSFFRHSWASFYVDWRRMADGGFAATVRRELELV